MRLSFPIRTFPIATFALLLATAPGMARTAHADGFVCGSLDRELEVKVYHHTNPALGTRNAAVMIVSDPTDTVGDGTLARFSDHDGNLVNYGTLYRAQVGHEVMTDAFVGAIPLREIDHLELWVHFTYNGPVAPGDHLDGELTVYRPGGENHSIPMTCVRYLKN